MHRLSRTITRKEAKEMARWQDERDVAYQAAINAPLRFDPFSLNGWMNLDGKLFACGYGSHLSLADHISHKANGAYGSSPSKTLENLGWVKVQNEPTQFERDPFPLFVVKGNLVTQAQFNAIDKWCAHHKQEIPLYLEVK